MKLPNITYNPVQSARLPGPESAVAEYEQKQRVTQAVFDVAHQYAERTAKYESDTALSEFADGLSQFENEVAPMRVASPEQIEEWGLSDRVSTTTADGRRREYIPKHEWYAFLKQDRMGSLKEQKAGDITSPVYREAWTAQVSKIEREQTEQAVAQTARQALEFERDRVVADFNAALVAGNWQTARDKLSSEVFADNPELKARLLDEVAVSEESARINRLARDGSPEQMLAEAERMGSDDYIAASPLNADQAHQKSQELKRLAKMREAENEAKVREQNERYNAKWWEGLLIKASTDGISVSDLAGISDLPFLSPADIRSAYGMLDNAAANGSPYAKVTDPGVYLELHDALASGDALAFRKSLQQSIPNLKESDWQYFVKAGEKLTAEPDYAQGVATDAQIVGDALKRLGIDTTKTSETRDISASQQADFRRNFEYEVGRQERDMKRSLTPSEKMKIADNLTLEFKTKDPTTIFGFEIGSAEYSDVYDYIYQDVGEDQRAYDTTMRQITEALEANNLPATQEEIIRLYRSTK